MGQQATGIYGQENATSRAPNAMEWTLRSIGRFRSGAAIQVALKPVELPLQAFNEVLRFAGAGEVVVFAREYDDLRGNAIMLERAEPLLALFEGNAIVVVGMKDQCGGVHAARVLQR